MKIYVKLLFGFLIVVLLIGGFSIYGSISISSEIQKTLGEIHLADIAAKDIGLNLKNEFREIEEFANGYSTLEDAEEEIEEIEEKISENFEILTTTTTPNKIQLLRNIVEKEDGVSEEIFKNKAMFDTSINEFDEIVEELDDATNNLIKMTSDEKLIIIIQDIRINLGNEFREIEEFANGYSTLEDTEEEIEEIEEKISKGLDTLDTHGVDTSNLRQLIEQEDEIRKNTFVHRINFVQNINEFDKIVEELDIILFSINDDFKVITDQSKDNVFTILNLNYVIIGIVIILSIVLSFYISRNISKPISKLQNAVIEIAHDDLDVNLAVKGSDEISSLVNSFNKMMISISESEKNLKAKIIAESELEQAEKFNKLLIEKEQKIQRQLEELKLLDTQKAEFLAMVSHELRTPLVPIRGNVEVLLDEDNPERLSDNQTKLLKSVFFNSERLSDLIYKIILTQRIGLGKYEYTLEDLSAKKLVDEIFQSYSPTMEKKQIKFEYLVKNDLVVNCDKRSFDEILQSLLNNAMEYVPEKNAKIEICAKAVGDRVVFFVKDNGEGIPLEKQGQLFTPFYQVDSSLGKKHKGTGLGLAICKDLVQGMGGKIWVESEGEGKGSTFYFSLKKGDKK